MTTEWNFTKIKQPKAEALCHDIDLQPKARSLLKGDLTPAQYLALLIEHELTVDAVRFLARALPKREATWWACLCARKALEKRPSAELSRIVELTERWVYRPTEENRRAAMQAAEASEFDNAASWAAMAAFWSGGSMAPAGAPVVLPSDDLTAKAVAGAVMLAAVAGEAADVQANYRLFFRQGINIAEGGNGRIAGAP